MSGAAARHEYFQYEQEEEFLIMNMRTSEYDRNNLTLHWHKELEIMYALDCENRHYIDGICVQARPGRLIVTNSESLHSIVEVGVHPDKTLVAIVLILSVPFLEKNFPEYKTAYFTNEKEQCREEIREIMMKLSKYQDAQRSSIFSERYARGLILQLLYYMGEEGMQEKNTLFHVNYLKDIERLKAVYEYVEQHYQEPISQAQVAERFYFTKEYFARYFKKSTGITFMNYLKRFRLQQARKELLETEHSILNIALNNGFSDDRAFINAFKSIYHNTPFQYRQRIKSI